ncbi:hypothetical protein PIB30_087747 [Stylosanthes scabra]|uniref:Uncharacterized protein n=1 Tax=Stylosanthes scabra TaxID=79078 RepID=A0ABU6ZST5_9FABA|nr:hypothetical protein [Stylosanthes scabra]
MESTRLPRPVQQRQQEDEEEDHPMPQAGEGNEEENIEEQGYEEPPVQQPPLYHIPTYTDQHQKDLDSIETQLQNMMWYQQQTFENISKNQAEYMAELRDIKGKQQELYDNNDKFYNQVRQEQKEMVQEIQQIKNYQVNQTLVDSTRHKAYLEELAAIKTKQEEFFSNQKIVKQIYDNIDHKRPMFKGLLKCDLQPSDPAPPPSSSNDPKDPPK